MTPGTIAQRVADFLRQHQPFCQISEEDLLFLASKSRVRFYENGEMIFSEGQPRNAYLQVVYKGVVRLTKKWEQEEETFDIREAGDIIGLDFFAGQRIYQHSAKTEGETILYGLPSELMLPMLPKYPEVAQWLGSYFSLSPTNGPVRSLMQRVSTSTRRWLDERQTLPDWVGGTVGFCYAGENLFQAARTLSYYDSKTLMVVDGDLRPVGLVDTYLLRDLAARTDISWEDPVQFHMERTVPTAKAGLTVGEYLALMLEKVVGFLVITEDGTTDSPVYRGLSHEDLLLVYGTDPVVLAQEMTRASNDTERRWLQRLRERAEAYIAAAMAGRDSLVWFGRIHSAFLCVIARRWLELVEQEFAETGIPWPSQICLAVTGRAARQEYFGAFGLDWIVLVDDGYQPLLEQGIRKILFDRLLAHYLASGFQLDAEASTSPRLEWVKSLREWNEQYGRWFCSPAGPGLLEHLAFLDLRAAAGAASLLTDLQRTWHGLLLRNREIIREVISYALRFGPPLTILKNTFVEESGATSRFLNLKTHVLHPVVHVARILAFTQGQYAARSTVERLREVLSNLPQHRSVLEETCEAFLLVLYVQSRAILLEQRDGSKLYPAELPKMEQHQLKTTFRSISQFLEWSANWFQVEVPLVDAREIYFLS